MRFVKSICIAVLVAGCQTSTAPEPQPEISRPDIPMLPGENIDQFFSRIATAVPGFGGFFHEKGRLVCWLTDTRDVPRLHAYFRSLGATSVCDEVRQGQFDFNQLHTWRRKLWDARISYAGVCTDDNNEVLNRTGYTVPDRAAYDRVVTLIRSTGVPLTAVVITIAGCPMLMG